MTNEEDKVDVEKEAREFEEFKKKYGISGERETMTPEEREEQMRKLGMPEKLIDITKKYMGKKIEGAPKPQKTKPPEEQPPPLEYEIVIESEESLDDMDLCAYVGSKGKIVVQKGCKLIKAERR
jgi:hypothetical protein